MPHTVVLPIELYPPKNVKITKYKIFILLLVWAKGEI